MVTEPVTQLDDENVDQEVSTSRELATVGERQSLAPRELSDLEMQQLKDRAAALVQDLREAGAAARWSSPTESPTWGSRRNEPPERSWTF